MEHENVLEEIEISNALALEAKETGEALQRLLNNEDYQKIIVKGYLSKYPKDLGEAIANNTGAYDSDKLFLNMKGINTFIGYTFSIGNAYNAAIQTLVDNEEYIANSVNSEEV